ncbi:MAG: glycosyltransferase family 2 protein [Spartobacteria bacterium]|nr:glycosyltransferase family 2 protein [Spartobacteria bacterium]
MENAKKTGISVFFPVYNDATTIRQVTEKALRIVSELANEYEVVIVDDCGPDRSGELAEELAAENGHVKVVHHPKNLGYGAAIRTGLATVQHDWICFTDGDDEYDLEDLRKLWRLRHHYDLIITFRYAKLYSGMRIFISAVYNFVLRRLFRTRYRDISTGLRLVRKEVVEDLDLEATSPFIGAEIAIKAMLKGYPVGEVGIQTFPREFGKGASTSIPNIIKTIKDMLKARKTIFSPNYDLPATRDRT